MSKNKLTFPNLNFRDLRKVCSMKPRAIAHHYGLEEFDSPAGHYWYKDNDADILAVAHLDSNYPFMHFAIARLKPDTLIYCPTLDDRLGAYIVLEWLQKAGVDCDILLTENEEQGQSTALWFEPKNNKSYNWMFSFDRRGTDAVMYQYRDPDNVKRLTAEGFDVGYGSYSCIKELEHLECKGFNFGTGYHNEHSPYAYASRSELVSQLRKFLGFYETNKDMCLIHIKNYYAISHSKKHDKKESVHDEFQRRKAERDARAKEEVKDAHIISEESRDKTLQARKMLLLQPVSILNLSYEILQKLMDINITFIGELVQATARELLNAKTISGKSNLLSSKDTDTIREVLMPLGLGLATNIERLYGINIIAYREYNDKHTNKLSDQAVKDLERSSIEGARITSRAEMNKETPLLPEKAASLAEEPKYGSLEYSKYGRQGPEDKGSEEPKYKASKYYRTIEGVKITEPGFPTSTELSVIVKNRALLVKQAHNLMDKDHIVTLVGICLVCGNEYQIDLNDEKACKRFVCNACLSKNFSEFKSKPKIFNARITSQLSLNKDPEDNFILEFTKEGPVWKEKVKTGFKIPSNLVY